MNRAGERLLARPAEQLLDRTAQELGFGELLKGEPSRAASIHFPGGIGRWGVRRGSFRQEGRPHQILVMTDLSRALRDEEWQAWQRIVGVAPPGFVGAMGGLRLDLWLPLATRFTDAELQPRYSSRSWR